VSFLKYFKHILLLFQLLPEQQDKLRAQQLKLYEALLGGSSLRAKHLLSHQPFLKPLIDLLSGKTFIQPFLKMIYCQVKRFLNITKIYNQAIQ
jgi:hypothetical protein